MFVQVIKGKTNDPEGMRRQGERWNEQVGPVAKGFLGSTSGVADDGTFVTFARFEDEAAARANFESPEQTAWWQEMSKYIEGEPSFRESNDVALLLDGGSDQAGFVQVMEGTVADRAKAESFETPEMLEQLRKARPDLLGSLRVWFDGGAYVEAAYFTSEEDARKGESSSDFTGPQEEYTALFGELSFIDLRDLQLS